MSGGTDIDVVLHLFDASPKTDYLIIKGGKLTQEKEKMELVIEIEKCCFRIRYARGKWIQSHGTDKTK